MSVRVEIDVFSGRPNPVVELDGDEAAAILERIGPGRRANEEIAAQAPPVLGYRGIVFEQLDQSTDDLPRQFRLVDGQVLGHGLAHAAADEELEGYILSPDGPFAKAPIEVDDFFPRANDLWQSLILLEWWKKWPWDDIIISWPWPKACSCGPIYEPGWWNVPSRQPYNNCYNYSTNYRTDTFAQPGQAAGAKYTALACDSVRPAAIADKLLDAPDADNKCPEQGHLVALVVAPRWDYHWYRKGADGWWSHKPGGTAVTNLDNAGKQISDPRNADRGPYTDWCTFMVVMHGHIKIS